MKNFEKAQQEYENKLLAPYDKWGELFNEEEYIKEKEDYLDTLGDLMLEKSKQEQK